jgi:hypothetical protein
MISLVQFILDTSYFILYVESVLVTCYPDSISDLKFYCAFFPLDCLNSVRRTRSSFDLFASDVVISIDLCLSLKLYSSSKCCKTSVHFYCWHGYVLHKGITYKIRVPRTSQRTSRLLRNTAADMRAHNVLCNSYNTWPLLCARITCHVTVITVEINHCSFRRVRFTLLYIVTLSKIV